MGTSSAHASQAVHTAYVMRLTGLMGGGDRGGEMDDAPENAGGGLPVAPRVPPGGRRVFRPVSDGRKRKWILFEKSNRKQTSQEGESSHENRGHL